VLHLVIQSNRVDLLSSLKMESAPGGLGRSSREIPPDVLRVNEALASPFRSNGDEMHAHETNEVDDGAVAIDLCSTEYAGMAANPHWAHANPEGTRRELGGSPTSRRSRYERGTRVMSRDRQWWNDGISPDETGFYRRVSDRRDGLAADDALLRLANCRLDEEHPYAEDMEVRSRGRRVQEGEVRASPWTGLTQGGAQGERDAAEGDTVTFGASRALALANRALHQALSENEGFDGPLLRE
ncbi:unnamed protein product, partial [Discosporangium mesarthrocarpum]